MTETQYRIGKLAEECVEVAKECMKAQFFGLDDQITMDPNGPRGTEGPTCAEKIHAEMVDLIAAYIWLSNEGLVPKLGVSIISMELQEKVVAKHAKVAAYGDYSRRVGQMDAIPKLTTMACFSHGSTPPNPFRVLMEGPNGYSFLADGKTPEDLIARLIGGGTVGGIEGHWPPTYTEETLPTEPTPCYIIHPDYHDDDPPMVTMFPKERDEHGGVKCQWHADKTIDFRQPDELRPVFTGMGEGGPSKVPRPWMREPEDEAEAKASGQPDTCPQCLWSNGKLMNYSTKPGVSRWLCHGCAARAIEGISKVPDHWLHDPRQDVATSKPVTIQGRKMTWQQSGGAWLLIAADQPFGEDEVAKVSIDPVYGRRWELFPIAAKLGGMVGTGQESTLESARAAVERMFR